MGADLVEYDAGQQRLRSSRLRRLIFIPIKANIFGFISSIEETMTHVYLNRIK
jgi:hypothetical protein